MIPSIVLPFLDFLDYYTFFTLISFSYTLDKLILILCMNFAIFLKIAV